MSKPNKHKGKVRYDKQAKSAAKPPADAPVAPSSGNPPRRAATKEAPPGRVVTLTPLAPLIVRSGRPFDGQTGADEARVPPPSTIAGCLRTAWARATGRSFGPELANLEVAGPLLARPTDRGGLDVLAPKPADAHYFGHGHEAQCVRAAPGGFEDGSGSDLPQGLQPVRLIKTFQGKPSAGPAWWTWQDLLDFRQGQAPLHADLERRGWTPPADDRRTHVAIDPTTLAAASGRLFQTAGLDLEATNPGLSKQDRPGLCLLARCAEPLPAGLVPLGGERRLARLEPETLDVWPTPPNGWFGQIQAAAGLTLTLLTPACFGAGYRPGWLDSDLTGTPPTAPGVRLQLVAVASERWQPHSGWDLARHQPRATRKLVAAGAVYWFRLLDCPDPTALAPLWLASLCDDAQDRRDGYGLVLPAPWTPTV
jgi:CRISPR-associated protein Cmr3